MDFNLTEEQKMIAHSAREIAKEFGPEYWREKEENKEFALFLPLILDTISTDWLLETGNDLLATTKTSGLILSF